MVVPNLYMRCDGILRTCTDLFLVTIKIKKMIINYYSKQLALILKEAQTKEFFTEIEGEKVAI